MVLCRNLTGNRKAEPVARSGGPHLFIPVEALENQRPLLLRDWLSFTVHPKFCPAASGRLQPDLHTACTSRSVLSCLTRFVRCAGRIFDRIIQKNRNQLSQLGGVSFYKHIVRHLKLQFLPGLIKKRFKNQKLLRQHIAEGESFPAFLPLGPGIPFGQKQKALHQSAHIPAFLIDMLQPSVRLFRKPGAALLKELRIGGDDRQRRL